MPKARPRARASTAVVTAGAKPKRDAKGHWLKGSSGSTGIDPARARKALNNDTIREMHEAFKRGGRAAIAKVMKNQPAVFLKLLILLVPRELEVTQHQGIGTMSSDQIEAVIARIEEQLERRQGNRAKVIEHSA